MKHDVNGWSILKRHFKQIAAYPEVIDENLSSSFNMELLRTGERLLSFDETVKLISKLKLSSRRSAELVDHLITARWNHVSPDELQPFQHLALQLHDRLKIHIPCAEIDILSNFQPLDETLHDFMCRSAIASFKAELPKGACALWVTRCRMSRNIEIPPGSLIIVNGRKPATPDELSLCQYRNRQLFLGRRAEADSKRLKWSSPILQIQIRAV